MGTSWRISAQPVWLMRLMCQMLLAIYPNVCVDVQPGHLSADKHNCTLDIWKASLLSVAWCGAAGSPSGWRKLRTDCTGMAFHLEPADRQRIRLYSTSSEVGELFVWRVFTCVAALVHHQHVGPNADHPAHFALEPPIGKPDRSWWRRLRTGRVIVNARSVSSSTGVLDAAVFHGVPPVVLPALIPRSLSVLRLQCPRWLVVTAQFNLNGVCCVERERVRGETIVASNANLMIRSRNQVRKRQLTTKRAVWWGLLTVRRSHRRALQPAVELLFRRRFSSITWTK